MQPYYLSNAKKCINRQKQRKQKRYRKFRINKIGKYFHQICQNPKEYSVNLKKNKKKSVLMDP